MDTKRVSLDTTLTLIAAHLGLFVSLIDANPINLALPSIGDNLGGGISGAEWTIDAYNITICPAGSGAPYWITSCPRAGSSGCRAGGP